MVRFDRPYRDVFGHRVPGRFLIAAHLLDLFGKTTSFQLERRGPSNFVTATEGSLRAADLVWYYRVGPLKVATVIEFTSSPGNDVIWRLLEYAMLVAREELVRSPQAQDPSPFAVTGIIVYNGWRPWRGPRSIEEALAGRGVSLQERLGELHRAVLRFPCTVLDIHHDPPERWEPFPWLRQVVLLERARDQESLERALEELNELLAAEGTPELRRTFDLFLEKVVRPVILPGEVAAMNREQIEAIKKQVATEGRARVIDRWILEAWEEGRTEGLEKGRREGIEQGRREGIEQGRREGIEKGRQEGLQEGQRRGRAEALRELLRVRFGGVSPEAEARLAAASSEELLHWLRRAAQVDSLDAVFEPPE